ncbi:hypothetical protein EYC84_009457 [Monilinia fructicola]|uniref:Uncharacterized protein n=1 Tax=Monilinia fructicola TaxID=38448 RepID=A0A5M9JEK5_MONFR|nr:hypothetical protein EYC84_009457 [Monilinia fructicola]
MFDEIPSIEFLSRVLLLSFNCTIGKFYEVDGKVTVVLRIPVLGERQNKRRDDNTVGSNLTSMGSKA